MSYRFVAVSFTLFAASIVAAMPAVAQYRQNNRQSSTNQGDSQFADTFGSSNTGRINGTVRTFDGHAVSDAGIEVHDIEHGSNRYTVRTDASGSFALYNIPPGNYEITATSGVDEVHERTQVTASSLEANVDLRMGGKSSEPRVGTGSTISLSQYTVPAKARSLYEKSLDLMNHGKLEESRKKIDAAIAIFPKFAEALSLRAALKGQAGKVDDAIADFQQAIDYDPNYPTAYLALASLLNSTGRFKESTPVLLHAEQLVPNAWQTYFELSRNHLGKGEFVIALHDIDRATELIGGEKKESPEMHLIRGYALVGLSNMTQAAHELKAFLASEPTGHLADHARSILDRLQNTTTVTASE